MKHIMAITAPDKIDAVRNGKIRRSIRSGNRFTIGDTILIHGWTGKPYRTPWNWRMNVVVSDVTQIKVNPIGIETVDKEIIIPIGDDMQLKITSLEWDSTIGNQFAESDGIKSSNGVSAGVRLRDTLYQLNAKYLKDCCARFQIVDWEVL